jgi:hypothetical protein
VARSSVVRLHAFGAGWLAAVDAPSQLIAELRGSWYDRLSRRGRQRAPSPSPPGDQHRPDACRLQQIAEEVVAGWRRLDPEDAQIAVLQFVKNVSFK